MNKGSIYITERSPQEVSKAYVDQFNVDFSLFLRLRSEELIVGGKMVLIFLGRESPLHIDRGNSFFWELLTQSFSTLISQVTLNLGSCFCFHNLKEMKFRLL